VDGDAKTKRNSQVQPWGEATLEIVLPEGHSFDDKTPDSGPHIQLNIFWSTHVAYVTRYLDLLQPLLVDPDSGCERFHECQPVSDVVADGIDMPMALSVLRFQSAGSLSRFQCLAGRGAFGELRRDMLAVACVEGECMQEVEEVREASAYPLSVEIAKYGARGVSAYQLYEANAAPILRRHGYRSVCVVRPKFTGGLTFAADIMRIGYFTQPDGFASLREDALFPLLLEWRQIATAGELWVIGQRPPVSRGSWEQR
jgi:hypothetical protein